MSHDVGYDPHLERMVQEGLKRAPDPTPTAPEEPLAQGQVWQRVGGCPKCGAPIWSMMAAPAANVPPRAIYSCPCAHLENRRARRELDLDLEAHPPPSNGAPG